MTNPDNALGTNGAFGGRTSVNAFNDVLATFDGAGIVSGFVVEPDSGMTVAVGGDGTTRDVAVAEDPFGNRTTVDNISGDPISVTINTASTTSARIDSIVAYVNSPATASDTSVDNPTACGIISVNGTSGGAPIDSAIRTAITADGGTGSTAYYVVIANVSVPANTTTITSGLISDGKSINLTNVATTGSNGLMSGADKTKLNGINQNVSNYSTTATIVGTWTNGKPIYRKVIESTTFIQSPNVYFVDDNIEQFINQYGFVQRKDVLDTWQYMPSRIGTEMSLSFQSSSTAPTLSGVQIDWGTGWINNYSARFNKIVLVVEYTKTTD